MALPTPMEAGHRRSASNSQVPQPAEGSRFSNMKNSLVRPRLLVVILAYEQAEGTLAALLDRIFLEVVDSYFCEVLVIDDPTSDYTSRVAREYRNRHPARPLTTLLNEYSQGCGGNQKIAYSYAIAEQFDFVAVIQDGGQYAEVLLHLVEPLRREETDLVLGSRVIAGDARKSKMPFRKHALERLLTATQNLMLRSGFSDLYSGFRAYSVKALESVPYRLNSNGLNFETEIIIQLLNASMRIMEAPIPSHRDNVMRRTHGLKHSGDALLTTLRSVLHRAGLLYQRRFDANIEANHHYELKLGYASSHSWALEAVPDGASVLDIGAGPGSLATELMKKGCTVGIVDQHVPIESGGMDVVKQNLDDPLQFDIRPYEYIFLLDIIEHLRSPEQFLERLRKQFDNKPKTVILTTPNIAFIVQRLMLLIGQFNYGREGILDATHTRLFTFRTLEHLLRDAGFRITRIRGIPAPFPKLFGPGVLGKVAVSINLGLIFLSKTLFAYQIFVEAETTPDVEFLLRDAKRLSEICAIKGIGPANSEGPFRRAL